MRILGVLLIPFMLGVLVWLLVSGFLQSTDAPLELTGKDEGEIPVEKIAVDNLGTPDRIGHIAEDGVARHDNGIVEFEESFQSKKFIGEELAKEKISLSWEFELSPGSQPRKLRPYMRCWQSMKRL